MYLFSRTARLQAGRTRESMAWAVGITEKVNQITSLNVGLWTTALSPGVGTLSWSTVVENLTQLEDAEAKLMVDDGYVDLVDQGAQFSSGEAVNDLVGQIVSGELDPARRPTHAAVVSATLAPGGFAKGVEAGIEIADRATKLSGLPTVFMIASTGEYGGVAWLTTASSLEELERGEQATNGDPEFIRYIDEVASKVYQAQGTTQTLFRRLV
ncbi:MAG TPA: hypothetical protein VFK42_05095 [Acidimicrobiales bacterium]|nr:hypothetical protein [Acidimicrobiales bacterium]